MLNTIRKYSSGWVAQILMGLLVISFGFWGIASSLTGFTSNSVAKVGGTEITTTAFDSAYRLQLQNMSQRLGTQVTPDQAKMMGLPSQVLGTLVAEAALNDQARQMSLGVSDATLIREIAADPAFKGAAGTFDRNYFMQVLSQNGLNEDSFVVQRRALEERRQLADSLSGGATIPNVLAAALHTYQTEARTIRYVVVPASVVGDVGSPNTDELAAYYNDNKTAYRAPELRSLTILKADPADIERPADISDADAQKSYDQDKSRFATEETRHVFQLVFTSATSAQAAADKLKAGATFESIVADDGKKLTDTDLGVVSKTTLLDPKIADAAFSLAPNATSPVVDGSFGPVIVHVTDVNAASVKPFAEVKDQIKSDLALAAAKSDVNNLRDAIEDARAGGSTLDEIAAKNKLKVSKIQVDAAGKDKSGTAVADIPASAALLKAAFDSDVGIDNAALQTESGGYVWFTVTDVAAAHDRPLAEVQDKVVTAWKKQALTDKLAAKAKDAKERITKGETLDAVAQSLGQPVQTLEAQTRNSKPTDSFSAEALKAAFNGPKGYADAAAGVKDDQQIVVQVADVVDTPYTAGSDDSQIDKQLAEAMLNDLLQEYLSELQNKLGVTVNQPALQQVVGAS